MKIGKIQVVMSAVVVAVAILQAGCATGAKPQAMVADKFVVPHRLASDVSVTVSGGKQTSSMGASQISDQDFGQALRESIEKSSLFRTVTESGGRYRLTAFIGKVDQPMIGLSLTVKMEVSYTLVDTQTGQTAWSKNIASEYTAKTGDAFAAVVRLRLANEGAARANIEDAILEMSKLQL